MIILRKWMVRQTCKVDRTEGSFEGAGASRSAAAIGWSVKNKMPPATKPSSTKAGRLCSFFDMLISSSREVAFAASSSLGFRMTPSIPCRDRGGERILVSVRCHLFQL